MEERQRRWRTDKDVGGQRCWKEEICDEEWTMELEERVISRQTKTLEETEALEDGQKNLRTDRYWRIDRGIRRWTEALEDEQRH